MNKLHKELKKQKQKTQQVELEIYGSLGIPLGGRRLTDVPDRPSFVYVRLRDNQNEVVQAFNNKVTSSYNLPVILHREGSRYVVDGVNTQRYQSNWNNAAAYLPRHGTNHSFYDGGGGDVTWVYSRQIMPYLVYPDSTITGSFLKISPHTLLDVNNQWKIVGGTGTPSVLQYLPTGGNDAIMGLLYIDSPTGNPKLIINSGTPFSNLLTGTGDIYQYIPVPNINTQIPLAAIRLSSGTNNINWDNIYDVRQWIHTFPSGTSSGGGGNSSGTYVNIWDEGVLKGVVNTLDVVSNVADISVSGSVARLFITGSAGGGTVSPPITGSFVVQNNGLTLGSATILNFTNGVTASISGSVAQIQVTGTSTYIRVAPPISLSSITGTYWKTQENIFASGSLALFNQGHALIPAIDYLEQYPVSGTFQYISTPPTGTYNLAIYGVPSAGGNTGGGVGGGGLTLNDTDPYGIFHRISGSNAFDDEYSSNTSANYSTIIGGGSGTWTISNHVLTCMYSNQGSAQVHAYVKPIALSDGDWLETNLNFLGKSNTNYSFFGMILTDGVLTSSNAFALSVFRDNVASEIYISFYKGTCANIASGYGLQSPFQLDTTSMGAGMRIRLMRVSSSAYGWFFGLGNGAIFTNENTANQDPGFTPSYAGFFTSVWGSSHTGIISFDFIRKFP